MFACGEEKRFKKKRKKKNEILNCLSSDGALMKVQEGVKWYCPIPVQTHRPPHGCTYTIYRHNSEAPTTYILPAANARATLYFPATSGYYQWEGGEKKHNAVVRGGYAPPPTRTAQIHFQLHTLLQKFIFFSITFYILKILFHIMKNYF